LVRRCAVSQDAESIARTKLFAQFDKLAPSDITDTEVGQLKSMVTSIADDVGPLLDRITDTFFQYTGHDVSHCCNVADLIYRFLPKTKSADGRTSIGLNALELTMLWLAILLHDVGMVVSVGEKQHALDSHDYRTFRGLLRDRFEAAKRWRSLGQELRARAIEDAMLAEYFRRLHPQRATSYIYREIKRPLVFRGLSLAEDIGRLCESHAWGVRESNDPKCPDNAVDKLDPDLRVSSARVNLRYLAVCLRLGDVLDFDMSRTPLSVFELIDFTEDASIAEWNKHISIHGWNIDESSVRFDARCTQPTYYVAVNRFLDYVDRELEECRFLIDDAHETQYTIGLPVRVDRRRIRMKDPNCVVGNFRFQLDFDRIMQLLMDKSLYPDSTLFLRELTQNALDACRCQMALAMEAGMPDKYLPRIVVWDHSDDPDNPRIVVQDNGVGMSLRIVEEFFLRIGRSYYRSHEFDVLRHRLSEKHITLHACSQFGIGFLSCFLVANHIEIDTWQYGNAPLHIRIDGPSEYFVVTRKPEPNGVVQFKSPAKATGDGPPKQSGTRISVHLKSDAFSSNAEMEEVAYVALKASMVNQEVPIEVFTSSRRRPQKLDPLGWETETPLLPDVRPGKGIVQLWDKKSPLEANEYDNVMPLLRPSRVDFERWDFSREIRGAAWIWLFDDGSNGFATTRGDLRLHPADVFSDGKFDTFVTRIAFGPEWEHMCNWDEIEQSDMLLGEVSQFLLDNEDEILHCPDFTAASKLANGLSAYLSDRVKDGEIEALSHWTLDDIERWMRGFAKSTEERKSSTIEMFMLAADSFARNCEDREPWWRIPSLAQGLANGDSIFDHKVPAFNCDLEMNSQWELAQFGIRVPANILDWNIQEGVAQSRRFLPASVSARLDAWGSVACVTSANRLFLPGENAGSLILAVGRAIIKHAVDLVRSHDNHPEWEKWCEEFLKSCNKMLPAVWAELPLVSEFIQSECHLGGKTVTLNLREIVETFGTTVPMWYYTDKHDGICRNWFVDNLYIDKAQKKADLSRVATALGLPKKAKTARRSKSSRQIKQHIDANKKAVAPKSKRKKTTPKKTKAKKTTPKKSAPKKTKAKKTTSKKSTPKRT